MPQIIYTEQSQRDLVRLYNFLSKKDKKVALRAIQIIRSAIKETGNIPEGCRPVPDLPSHREVIIDFGASGYVARFRYERGGNIYIVRIKHQLEDE